MGSATTYENEEQTLINRNLDSINIRSVNYMLAQLFQKYSIALNEITGGNLMWKTQVRQIQDLTGLPYEFDKGRIVVKNGVDRLNYLIEHKEAVAEAIGVDASYIQTNRRDLGKMYQCLAKMDGKYDIGDISSQMQIYISRTDDNIQSLDSQQDWIDYILTQSWITNLAEKAANIASTANSQGTGDYRHEYLADMLNRMMRDHEISLHKNIETFNEVEYLDSPDGLELKKSRYVDARNRLMSFSKLKYVFYEIHKPIGGSKEKYLDVKVSTNGEIDMTGVIGLEDCEHVEWEYGSREYLRSLNTGNQRYDFRLSIPFNDANSIMWWKPDTPEQLEVDEEDEGKVDEPTGYRYYKPYETERFLRWFGTNFVPMIDLNKVSRQTVCQSPILSNDVQKVNYFSDATNIVTMNMTRSSIVPSTSQSLLNLSNRATMKVINKVDPPGQYAMFVVGGNQQTTSLAFHVTGQMLNVVQEMNHYAHTWDLFRKTYIGLGENILLLELTNTIYPSTEKIWDILFPDEKWIPDEWVEIFNALKELQRPTIIDILRFRQIDFELIAMNLIEQFDKRQEFLNNMNEADVQQYVIGITENGQAAEEIQRMLKSESLMCIDLFNYVQNFGVTDNPDELELYLTRINLSETQKQTMLIDKLNELFWLELDENEQEKVKQYEISYDNVTVDDLRESIQTFNNLIVRLPTNTYRNNMVSRHIFLDWKEYVDKSIERLMDEKKLHCPTDWIRDSDRNVVYTGKYTRDGFPIPETEKTYYEGIGTDGKTHKYVEYYIDENLTTPLVDYSYIKVEEDKETGKFKANFDRWDYWSEDDFK